MRTPEGKVKGALKKVLGAQFDWHQSLNDRYASGLPDFIALKNGSFFGIEAKAVNGKMSKMQLHIANRIREAGGMYLIAELIHGAIQLRGMNGEVYGLYSKEGKEI